jgi:hypothetical protein
MDKLRESRKDAIREVWLTLDPDAVRAFTSFGRELIDRLERYASTAESGKKE